MSVAAESRNLSRRDCNGVNCPGSTPFERALLCLVCDRFISLMAGPTVLILNLAPTRNYIRPFLIDTIENGWVMSG